MSLPSSRAVVVSFVLFAVGCGALVDPSPGSGSTSVATAPPRSTAPPADHVPATPPPIGPHPLAACNARPDQSVTRGLDSCVVARASMTVEVTGIAWHDPALAWKRGGEAWLEVRYQNSSATESIEYPGLLIASSDARAQSDTELHGDAFVHPDLYALSPCMVYDSRDHGFTLLSDLPSGTMLTFTLSPAVATGNNISSCNETLAKVPFSVIVP